MRLCLMALLAEPPRGWIIGTVEQFAWLREAHVSRVMCQHLLHDDLDAVKLLGRDLAPELTP